MAVSNDLQAVIWNYCPNKRYITRFLFWHFYLLIWLVEEKIGDNFGLRKALSYLQTRFTF